jgi:signal transduction histidine kinase
MAVDDLRALELFDGLTDAQLTELFEAGSEVKIEPGVELFHEGDPADAWWVLLSGSVALVRHVGREDTVVGVMDVPGRWAGGFRAWDEHGVYLATARGAADGTLLRVPSAVLREKSHAWFPFAGHLIEGLYRTARNIESTARQRESLAALGTLAAGLAHEINNPAAATIRAVGALENAAGTVLAALNRLARDEISPAQLLALDGLRLEIEPPAQPLKPMALADLEDALSEWLEQHGVARSWEIAEPLAAAGVDLAWCERVAAVLGETALEPGLEWVAGAISARALLSQIEDSTRRVFDLVAAIRSYSQMDRASKQTIDVIDGLESTLVMLGHKLRDGVTVVREYGDGVPRIEAYPGELNQVWTNVIVNAVEAMSGSGRLEIRTTAADAGVVVEIVDNGPGMRDEVAARAFDPFYTTKDVGQGTGLGLDIARRVVVERHHGWISIDSHPGSTTLRVWLPVRPAKT